jgi:hypothetical protein
VAEPMIEENKETFVLKMANENLVKYDIKLSGES